MQWIENVLRSAGPKVAVDERTYEIRTCTVGCPRARVDVSRLAIEAAAIIESSGLPLAVESRTNRPILRHHRFSVSISGCANSCSQPQIADFGVQGRLRPSVQGDLCSGCGECAAVCRECALSTASGTAVIDGNRCVDCGDCVDACSTGAIKATTGTTVLAGGKLGRKPQLARTLHAFAGEDQFRRALDVICRLFSEDLHEDERTADAVTPVGVEELIRRCG